MKRKRIFCLALTGVLAATALTACGGNGDSGDGNKPHDPNKTTLYVATYEGGVGKQWLDNAAARFEEKYKDTPFEDGKTGVQIDIQQSKQYNGETILGTLKSTSFDVFFTEDVNYYDHVNEGNFADITDIVTGSLSEFGEEGTIEEKIDPSFAAFLKKDQKYYALPFYEGLYGIIYNKDVFNDYKLYFKSSGTLEGDKADDLATFTSAESGDKLSAGPDGAFDTYDDGLPATYAQMETLCFEIKGKGKNFIPFSYATKIYDYPKRAIMTAWADAEGKEQTLLNYTLNGTATNLVSSITDGVVETESKEITPDNAYELQKQAGKYYALDFLKEFILGDGNYKTNGVAHTAQQTNFIKGQFDPSRYDVYAMHIDGSWWENEADSTFRSLVKTYGDEASRANSDFGFMPMPKPTKEMVGEKQTLLNQNNSFGFVAANSKKIDLAKKFLQFTTTNAELSAFTATTSTTRSFTYTMESVDEARMSGYAKSLYALKSTADIVNPVSTNSTYLANAAFFDLDKWTWSTKVGGTEFHNPFTAFNDKTVTSAKTYFDGMHVYYKDKWSGLVKGN